MLFRSIRLSKENKIEHVSIPISTLIFSLDFIDKSIKRVFESNLIPILPLSGIDEGLFNDAKEIGLEKNIPKIKKIISKNSSRSSNVSAKVVNESMKSKKVVSVIIGPNNLHDILDALDENH